MVRLEKMSVYKKAFVASGSLVFLEAAIINVLTRTMGQMTV